MKSIHKMLVKRIFALALTAVMMAQTAFAALPQAAYAAESSEPAAAADTARSYADKLNPLLTDYLPQVIEYTDPISGFTHPGVGVTKDILENIQKQLRAGNEPWKSYFETMLLDTWYSGTEVGPARNGGGFNNSQFISDASRAYAQAVMYFVTGDNTYRRNALKIIRAYENIDPESLAYFTDACIHTGIPTNKICIAAEIIRYSTYQVTEGFSEEELKWTEADTEKFISNFLSPEVAVFQSSPDRFMNQHLYTNMGTMSAYLFMDDAEGYNKAVEWFTVNRNAHDQGYNGSIKRLFREITTLDEVGKPEGSGTPITPVIQHVEMGRDQAHGCGDLTNAAIISRLMQSQNTKVDPVTGTVSAAANAVDCYAFLDDRLVKAADFFFEYMLGYDADWTGVPFAIDEDGIIKDMYNAFAAPYRGRYGTINFWDFYTYYRYTKNMSPEAIKAAWPFFYDGYTQKTYTTWDNPDGGGDFWLFLPAAAEGDTSFIPNSSPAGVLEIEHRGNVVSGKQYGSFVTEGETTYVHITPSAEGTRIAMNSAGIESANFQFRIRTKGIAKLSMSGSAKGAVYLPDTNGKWVNFSYQRTRGEATGDMYFFTVSDLAADGYVDVDLIYTAPQSILAFESGQEAYSLTTCMNVSFQKQFNVTEGVTDITYSLVGNPDGMTIEADGTVKWSAPVTGSYVFYVQAKSGDTVVLKRIEMTVSASRAEAVQAITTAVDANAVYLTRTKRAYDEALSKANAAVSDSTVTDDAFAALLTTLNDAIAKLELVSPLLKDDTLTDGTSLDFRNMNLGNRTTITDGTVPNWLDGEPGSFVGFWLVEDKGCIMDFGPDFKISVNKFGYQARAGFSDRLAGMQAYGSNDRKEWTKLTVKEAAYQQGYQTVDVDSQYHNEQYRYLMFKKTTEYPDVLSGSYGNLLEFGELRIWGTRYETGNLIESITMSSDALAGGRIKMGDTVKVEVQGRDTLTDLKVLINGINATITVGTNHLYTATAVMQASETCKTGAVSVQVDYKKPDGSSGETFYGTTDGSSLFLINSDAFIDIGTLAKAISGDEPYDGKRTPESNARTLFDKDLETFGDLKAQFGGCYTVDFGEGVGVSLSEVMLYPRSTGQNHAGRLNNTVIYGSNDTANETYADKTWTQLTPPVTGATNEVWTHIPESAIMNNGSYRFFKITGAENGDIAEVEFYGTYGADPSSIATQITSLPEQAATQTRLNYPSVPAGFTISIKSSSNDAVIGTDGTINAAMEDTTVNLVFTVASGERSADTVSIPVTVKGLKSLLTALSTPERGQDLALPTVPDGYTVTVVETDEKNIIAADGKITQPDQDTLVQAKLKLTRDGGNESVESEVYSILIYGSTEAGKVDVNKAVSITSNCDPYQNHGGGREGNAKLLFDGKTDTFGDLSQNGNYTIDFGNGVTVQPSKFRLYPRSSHFDRMNNTVISGSNDGQSWTPITAPVTGAQKDVWYEIGAENFVNYGSFRYFRISGASSGNISEVEFYGIVEGELTGPGPDIPPEPDKPAEPPEGEIKVADIATEIVASEKEWANPAGSGRNEKQVAALLFDNNLGTYGDLANNGNTYTIDFGEQQTFTATDFWVYPRDGSYSNKSKAEYVERLNGVKIQGSNDGQNWNDITDELSGLPQKANAAESDVKWYQLTMKSTTGTSYRYIRITGGQGGNMAEVKFYGEVKEITPPDPDERNLIENVNSIATVKARCQQWGNGSMSATDIGKMLFDGNLKNYGDLDTGKVFETGEWFYEIDFGENLTVTPKKFAVHPRDGSVSNKVQAEYVDRLNGVKFQGSADGNEWVDLTAAISGIGSKDGNAFKWHELTVTVEGSYRYIRITGGNGGNMAEVKIYGELQNVSPASFFSAEPDPAEPVPETPEIPFDENRQEDAAVPHQSETPKEGQGETV